MKRTADENQLDILVVEDSRTQAEHLRYILEKKDYRVSLTANGREALDFMKKTDPGHRRHRHLDARDGWL